MNADDTKQWASFIHILNDVVQISEKAGEKISRIYHNRTLLQYLIKEDRSPVSNADLDSNTIIEEALKHIDPTIPVISEETISDKNREKKGAGPVWLVDPLDGTKEFLNGIGEFTVNIALVVNSIPVMGVIHVPATGKTYEAVKGHGAFLRKDGTRRPLLPDPGTRRPYKILTSRFHAQVKNLDPSLFEIIPCGSSLKFCRIAEGAAHFYPRFGATMEWDTAAGQILIEETGGAIVDLEGTPLTYNKRSLYNPHFIAVSSVSMLKDDTYPALLQILQASR